MVIVTVDLRVPEVIKVLPILAKLRKEATQQKGYLSGNTLVGVEDRSLISIETIWQSLMEWKEWEKSETQIKIYGEIMPFLLEKPKVKIYRYLSNRIQPHISAQGNGVFE